MTDSAINEDPDSAAGVDVTGSDIEDRLIDTLLRETLAGGTPPNLAARILRRALSDERRRKFRRVALQCAAAMLMVAGILWVLWVPSKAPGGIVETPTPPVPAPPKENPPLVPPNTAWARGAGIQTKDEPQVLELGGYCKLEAGPNSSLVNEGKDKAEQVYIERGKLKCEINRKVGTFAVRTDSGTVSVTGTKFSVNVMGDSNNLSGNLSRRKRLSVAVQEGAVELKGWATTLRAGDEGGIVVGSVTDKTENSIELKEDDSDAPRRFAVLAGTPAAAELLDALRGTTVGSRVQCSWIRRNGLHLGRIQTLWRQPKTAAGVDAKSETVQGVVEETGSEWIVIQDIHEERGGRERYTPGLVKTGGRMGFDPEVLEAFRALKVGDRVKFEWIRDERKRIVKIEKSGE